VDRVTDEEYIFRENVPVDNNEEDDSKESVKPHMGHEERHKKKPFNYSEMMKLRSALEASPPLFNAQDAFELDAHSRETNEKSITCTNSTTSELLFKKLEKVNQQACETPGSGRKENIVHAPKNEGRKPTGTNVLVDMPTSSRFLMKAGGDNNMGFMPSGDSGRKLHEAVKKVDDATTVARKLESIRTVKKPNNDLEGELTVKESKASDFLTYWAEHVKKDRLKGSELQQEMVEEEKYYNSSSSSEEDNDEQHVKESSYVQSTSLNTEQMNKLKAVRSVIEVEFDGNKREHFPTKKESVESENLQTASNMVSSGTGPLTPRSATAGTIVERGDLSKDLQFTPEMTFTERLMLQKLRGLQRSWTAEAAARKE